MVRRIEDLLYAPRLSKSSNLKQNLEQAECYLIEGFRWKSPIVSFGADTAAKA